VNTYRNNADKEKRNVAMATITRGITVLALMLAGLLVGPGVAAASTDRITLGDVEAALNADNTGGSAVRIHNKTLLGAPADPYLRVSIRPFSENGMHHCAEDWHLIAVALIEPASSLPEAEAVFDMNVITFTLDDVVLTTTVRTPVKPFLNPEQLPFPGIEKAFWYQEGVILAPSDLSVGRHTVSFVLAFPDQTIVLRRQFYVDAAGTGACL
jgi:hypothetical protein